jgi:hypothetical protein
MYFKDTFFAIQQSHPVGCCRVFRKKVLNLSETWILVGVSCLIKLNVHIMSHIWKGTR